MANELLTNLQMASADRLAMAAGTSGITLMENAGEAVATAAQNMVAPGAGITVLCGPGNNGGDGFVAARLLTQRGYKVCLALIGNQSKLKGDAATMAKRWTGATNNFDVSILENADLVIDAVFGAGLSRHIPDDWAGSAVFKKLNASNTPVLAVDVPSGVNGTSGAAIGLTLRADKTVTFFRKKPGHFLYPGKALSGQIILADIGIPCAVLKEMNEADVGALNTYVNTPQLWLPRFPVPDDQSHKYTRGHALIVSGPANATGAARLAAAGALRIGAGLVTVASPPEAIATNAAHLTTIMLIPFNDEAALAKILQDRRKNTVVIGPGCGIGRQTRAMVKAVLKSGAATVLDADALTSFAGNPNALARAVQADPESITGQSRPVIMTPHEGELSRIFPAQPDEPPQSKLERARACAKRFNAVVVLKGPDTVVASPEGRASINDNAPPWLATAGSGDVLAGMIGGLLAQNMPAFEAASAAVWMHGAAANEFGRGLIAQDLPEVLPTVLQELDKAKQ